MLFYIVVIISFCRTTGFFRSAGVGVRVFLIWLVSLSYRYLQWLQYLVRAAAATVVRRVFRGDVAGWPGQAKELPEDRRPKTH